MEVIIGVNQGSDLEPMCVVKFCGRAYYLLSITIECSMKVIFCRNVMLMRMIYFLNMRIMTG